MRTEIDTTVVTVTWNSQSVIGSFLECLNAAMGEVAWQLIVADNDSHDSTLEITREVMSNARVVQLGRNAGYAAGINAAIEVAQRGTNVLVANPDVRLDAGAGQHLVESLRGARALGSPYRSSEIPPVSLSSTSAGMRRSCALSERRYSAVIELGAGAFSERR